MKYNKMKGLNAMTEEIKSATSGTQTVEDLLKAANQPKIVPAVEVEETPISQPTKKQEAPRAPRRRNQSVVRYKNEVTLRGTIAKLVEAKNVTIVTMAVKATMTISNYPTLMFFGDTREQVSKFKEGDRKRIRIFDRRNQKHEKYNLI